MELIFEIRDAEEGGFYARALGHPIFTDAETWEELRSNVLEEANRCPASLASPRLVLAPAALATRPTGLLPRAARRL